MFVFVALTYGAVRRGPARQTFTVTVPVVTRGVVGTVHTHLRALFAVVASWTNCKTHNVVYKMTCTGLYWEWMLKVSVCITWWFECMIIDANLDHSWVQCVQGGSHTLLSHGGSGTTVHRTGRTCCTGHRTSPLCILGDKGIKSESLQYTSGYYLICLSDNTHCSDRWLPSNPGDTHTLRFPSNTCHCWGSAWNRSGYSGDPTGPLNMAHYSENLDWEKYRE